MHKKRLLKFVGTGKINAKLLRNQLIKKGLQYRRMKTFDSFFLHVSVSWRMKICRVINLSIIYLVFYFLCVLVYLYGYLSLFYYLFYFILKPFNELLCCSFVRFVVRSSSVRPFFRSFFRRIFRSVVLRLFVPRSLARSFLLFTYFIVSCKQCA